MALPLGKLTIIVGAGLVGSVLAKEGRLPGAYDLFSGAYRIFVNPLKQENSTKLSSKPKYDTIMQQADMLREEISMLTPNRAITIVTGSQSGSGKYGIIVVVIVGSGYVWWKGWRLPDMMFATRHSLSDARASIAKQLENVYSSLSDTKKFLSSRIKRVDCKIDECKDNTAATRGEVSAIHDNIKDVDERVVEIRSTLLHMESRVSRIEVKQDETFNGVRNLVHVAMNAERNGGLVLPIQGAASRPALELPNESPTRSVSMPVNTSREPPSPTTNGSHRKQASFSSASSSRSSVSRLTELPRISNGLGIASISTPTVSRVINASEDTNGVINASEDTNGGSSTTTVVKNVDSVTSAVGRTFSNFFRRT